MSELLEIPALPRTDPAGKRLIAVLRADRRVATWVARRTLFGRLVIVLNLPMVYFLSFRTGGVTDPGARVTLTLWALALGCLIGCAVATVRAQRVVDGLLDRAGGRRVRVGD